METALEAPRDFRQFRARGRPTVTLDRGRILAAADDLQELKELGLDTLAGAMAFRQGELMRDAGPRRTWKLPRPEGALFLKVYGGVPWRQRFRPFGRTSSPARWEWDNIGTLRRAGFDVPEPVAMGESQAVLGVPAHSFLVIREVPGTPLDELLARGWPDPHGIGPAKARAAVIRDVAGMIRRFHACGFYHRDLYCGHLIVAEDPRWGRPYLIDLQRVEQNFPPRQRWLIKDLAALQHSAPPAVSRADRLRFLLAYLGKAGTDPEVRHWSARIAEKARRIAAHEPKFG